LERALSNSPEAQIEFQAAAEDFLLEQESRIPDSGIDFIFRSGVFALIELHRYRSNVFDSDERFKGWAKDSNVSESTKETLLDALIEAREQEKASQLYLGLSKEGRYEMIGYWLNESFNQVDFEHHRIQRRVDFLALTETLPVLIPDLIDFFTLVLEDADFRREMFRKAPRSWDQVLFGELIERPRSVHFRTYARIELDRLLRVGNLSRLVPRQKFLAHQALTRAYRTIVFSMDLDSQRHSVKNQMELEDAIRYFRTFRSHQTKSLRERIKLLARIELTPPPKREVCFQWIQFLLSRPLEWATRSPNP
jgi:hypothetical protein